MRVGITYSVELEDIPQEIINLLDEVSFPNNMDIKEINDNISDNNMLKALENIHHLRKSLSSIDYRLQDCAAIITGYTNTVAKKVTTDTSDESSNEG
jgi:predicted Zn-ribbon and HTH transcriptional regulator